MSPEDSIGVTYIWVLGGQPAQAWEGKSADEDHLGDGVGTVICTWLAGIKVKSELQEEGGHQGPSDQGARSLENASSEEEDTRGDGIVEQKALLGGVFDYTLVEDSCIDVSVKLRILCGRG